MPLLPLPTIDDDDDDDDNDDNDDDDCLSIVRVISCQFLFPNPLQWRVSKISFIGWNRSGMAAFPAL